MFLSADKELCIKRDRRNACIDRKPLNKVSTDILARFYGGIIIFGMKFILDFASFVIGMRNRTGMRFNVYLTRLNSSIIMFKDLLKLLFRLIVRN